MSTSLGYETASPLPSASVFVAEDSARTATLSPVSGFIESSRRLEVEPNWSVSRPTRSERPSHSAGRSAPLALLDSGVSTPRTRMLSTRSSSNCTSTVSPSATPVTSTVYVFEGSSALASSMPGRFSNSAGNVAVLKFADVGWKSDPAFEVPSSI